MGTGEVSMRVSRSGKRNEIEIVIVIKKGTGGRRRRGRGKEEENDAGSLRLGLSLWRVSALGVDGPSGVWTNRDGAWV